MSAVKKDYYAELDKEISRIENGLYSTMTTENLCDKIAWCYKRNHITSYQLVELCDRMMAIHKMFIESHAFQ